MFTQLEIGFPKPGSFCKTGFSVLGKAKVRVIKSILAHLIT